MKKITNIILKSVVSVFLLVLIFSKINFYDLTNVFKNINIKILIFSYLLFFFQQIIIAYSWQILLKAQKMIVPFIHILRVHFIGHFFGTFMPSSIGADIVRIYGLAKYLRQGVEAASSMFVCRALGYFVFFGIAIIAACILFNTNSDIKVLRLIVVLFVTYILGLVFFLNSKVRAVLGRLLNRFQLSKFENKINDIYTSIFKSFQYKKEILLVLILSLSFQVIGIIIIWLLGLSLNIKIPILYYFIYIPIIMAVTLLPISIGGIGVREGAFVYFFVPIGLTTSEALSLSFLLLSQWICLAIIGGGWYLINGFSIKSVDDTEKDSKANLPDIMAGY